MALETPNAIVAAVVLKLDAAKTPKFEMRSSNGILTLEEFLFGGSSPVAVMQLETPVTADEGCIVQQGISLSLPPSEAVLLSTIKDGPIGDPSYDAQPDDTLFGVFVNTLPPPPYSARFSIAVLHLPRVPD